MTITIGSTVLCAGQQRSSNGTPVGPANLRMGLAPGVMLRDYVGADRTQGELKFDAKTVFPHAAVTGRTSAVVGCAVAVNYTIEG